MYKRGMQGERGSSGEAVGKVSLCVRVRNGEGGLVGLYIARPCGTVCNQ